MQAYYDYCFDLLSRMIACNTTNPDGKEEALSQLLCDEMKKMGMKAQVQPIIPQRANVIGEIGEGEKALLLNGHLDVVPAVGEWSSDPFVMTERDGKFFGRGTADMKGPIAAMMTAMKWHLENTERLPGRVKMAFDADEELGTIGIHKLLEEDHDQYLGAVIGEPSMLEVCVTHKGLIRMRVNLHGKGAHASTPKAGVNSIEKAADAIIALRAANEELGQKEHPLLPRRTLTVTMIEGGEKENVIPSYCSFLLDIRPFPGDTYADMEALVNKHLQPLKEKDPDFNYTLTKVMDVFPGELPTDHPWTKKVVSIHNAAFGGDTKARDFGATCEQCFLLAKGIPTVICGPGSMAQAHIVDEYIDIEQLRQGVLFYKQVIADAFKE
ncbi:MAG: M20 family metallopeptidase [Clostridia bacterium]|nr:M20 family metallopeptidase [Clostridia bacterium]